MLFWHGGNLSDYKDNVKHKSGRYEYGPGLYATTHYGTAQKYAKGSRKLYLLDIQKGTELGQTSLPIESLKGFVQSNVTKSKRKEVIERLENRNKNGQVPAFMFVNILLNEDALKSSKMNALRDFLVDSGIDYEIVSNPFGWNETMIVLYNMNKISQVKQVTSKDKIKEFDLSKVGDSEKIQSIIASKRSRIARILYVSEQLRTADFRDISYLKKYLQEKPFHIYDFMHEFNAYPNSQELMEQAGVDPSKWDELLEDMDFDAIEEVTTKITNAMSEEEKKEFLEYLSYEHPQDSPSYTFMDFESYVLPSNEWLVHFSDNAYDIKTNGFEYGMDQMDKLGLTTNFSSQAKKYGGYNFAFVSDNKYASNAAKQGKYGKHAVMFRAPGVKVYHYPDQEEQIIFMGKDVSPKDIVLLENQSGDWVVMGGKRGELFRAESFDDAEAWVKRNYRQYQKPLAASSTIEVYRGEFSGNKGGNYWSTNKKWAAQFTQTGRIEEVKARKIKESDVFSPDSLPYAGDPDAIDKAIKEAKEKGFKAVRLDEGNNEPDSIYVFDKSALRIASAYDVNKYNGDIEILRKEAQKYENSEDLLRDGGFSIEALDQAAFGIQKDKLQQFDTKDLNIKWHDDMRNVIKEIKESGLTNKEWAEQINLSEPIEIVYEDGKLYVDDGHHRYWAAKILNKKLPGIIIKIYDKPIAKITSEKKYDYDAFHRSFFS